jgi:NADH dehydrogenase
MAARHRSQTICILGGTGFVGRSIARQLVRRGYSVRIPTRSRQRNRGLLVLPGVELRHADIHDPRVLVRVLEGCDAVINLVGILNERGHDGSGFKRAHVELVEKLVAACQEADVRRIIHMSALKANTERGPSHYLRTKGRAEQIIKDLVDADIDYTIFRPSVIFGPQDSFLNRFADLLRYSPVLPVAQLQARFAPVYVEDVAQAFVQAVEDSDTYGKTFELCGPDIYSLREILHLVCRETGIRRAIVPLPGLLGRIQAWVADYLIPGKPFSLDNLRSLSVASICSENGFAALGIAPRAMPLVARGYLKPRDDALSRYRQSARR